MRDYQKELEILCDEGMETFGFKQDIRYVERLKTELKHIEWQDEFNYFVDLHTNKHRFSKNENNLLVAYLLKLVDDFNIQEPPVSIFIADFPDVDCDYLPEIQQWLKNVWAPQIFGAEYVCNIGNYATYGIKSALQDMARVYGLSHDEVNQVTTQIEDKDDENKPITWEKALELNKELAAYCEQYPEVYDAAKRLYGRVRGMGKHAGGLIISSMPLADFVPLVVDKQGNPLSAWTEGLHAQDLAPVGLVKVDVLVITNLVQIAKCLKLIRERYGIEQMCNLPGQDDWSDTEKYQNDPEAIALANDAKLKCVFQFDSPGIRDLAKKGGVTSFDDLVAFTSLYRPGPMGCLKKGTLISTIGGKIPIEDLLTWHDAVAYVDIDGNINFTKRFLLQKTGLKKLVKIRTKSGKEIIVSEDHKFLTKDKKYIEAKNLKKKEKIAHSDTI